MLLLASLVALINLGPTAHAWLWPLFFLGQLVSILKRSSDAVRSKTNGVATRSQYLVLFWDILVYRAIIGAAIFWMWVVSPDAVTRALANFGVQINFTIPLVSPVAFGMGLVSDFIVEWVFGKLPYLKIELPPPAQPQPATPVPPPAVAGAAAGDGK